MSRPSEIAVCLAVEAAHDPYRRDADQWVTAAAVCDKLQLLGFECTAGQVAAWLASMSRQDAPWVARQRDEFDRGWEYQLTVYGRNDVRNRLPGVSVDRPRRPGTAEHLPSLP